MIRTGLDDDGDGALSSDEIDQTRYVCNGADGAAGQDGGSCSVADNGDGTKTISCDDGTSVTVSDGADGADGADGFDALVRTDVVAPGAECADGGVAVKTGVDADRSGTLEDTEVAQTTYVCNGAAGEAGTPGEAGADALVALVPEAPGAHCTAGGTAVQSGTDADGNGVLDADEIAQTTYVCNGLSASPLELGFNGFDAVVAGEVTPVSIDATLLQDPGVLVLWQLTLTDDAGPVAGAEAYYYTGAQGEDPADPTTWTASITSDAQGRATFGPAAGFPASDLFAGVTTDLGLLVADTGNYHLALDLVNADTGDVIDGGRVDFTAIPPMLTLSATGFDGLYAGVRGPVSVTSTLREDPGVPVRWRLTVTDAQGAAVEGAEAYYFSGAAGEVPTDSSTFVNAIVTDASGTTFFGPAAGFDGSDLLSGVTTLFDVSIPNAGTYGLALDLVEVDTGAVVGGGTLAFTVGS